MNGAYKLKLCMLAKAIRHRVTEHTEKIKYLLSLSPY